MRALIRVIYNMIDHETYCMQEPSFFYGRSGMRIEEQFRNGRDMANYVQKEWYQ